MMWLQEAQGRHPNGFRMDTFGMLQTPCSASPQLPVFIANHLLLQDS